MKFFSVLAVLLLGLRLLSAEEFTTGGVFVHSATANLSYRLLGKGTNFVDKLTVGKTYRADKEAMEVTTKDKDSTTLLLDNGLAVRVEPNSTFSVDAFNQMVMNYEDQPSLLQNDYSVTSLSLLDGQIEVISPVLNTNSQCIVQTPLVNVNVAHGKLSIKSNPKYVILTAVEGDVVVMDSKNKRNVIDKGNLGLIIPYPGREGEIMVTQKPVSEDDGKRLMSTMAELERQNKEVVFIIEEKKVVGIRLK